MTTTKRQPKWTLQRAFRASGMTQLELARAVGTSESHVNRWLNGHVIPGRYYRPRIERRLGEIEWPG